MILTRRGRPAARIVSLERQDFDLWWVDLKRIKEIVAARGSWPAEEIVFENIIRKTKAVEELTLLR